MSWCKISKSSSCKDCVYSMGGDMCSRPDVDKIVLDKEPDETRLISRLKCARDYGFTASLFSKAQETRKRAEKRADLTKQKKDDIKAVFSDRCAFCEYTKDLQIHHIIPVSKGGTADLLNLILLCPNHHRAAHSGALSIEELHDKVYEMHEAFYKKGRNEDEDNKKG